MDIFLKKLTKPDIGTNKIVIHLLEKLRFIVQNYLQT